MNKRPPKPAKAAPAEPAAQRVGTITMRDVAREADVSIGTVSRVVNKHPAVKPFIRERVEAAILQTGWSPNAIAQSMRTSATKTIGCVLPDIRNPLFAALVKGAEEVFRRQGYALIVANTNNDVEHELELITLLLQRRVDGFLLAQSDEFDTRAVDRIAAAHIPMVLVERELPAAADSVVSNQCNGVRQATDYLRSLGHQRIALVTGNPKIRPGRERQKGFLESCEMAGVAAPPEMMRLEQLTASYAYQEVQNLMALKSPPTAMIMGGNVMLAGALRAFTLKSIRIPTDVSIIAVGDTDLAELASPPITTVRWDLEGLGREAASVLTTRVANREPNPAAPRHIMIPTEIVLRQSCVQPKK